MTTKSLLTDLLIERYTSLRRRLTRRLGSDDVASEALHETWVSLTQANDLSPVQNADAYVYRSALYKGRRILKGERRYLDAVEIGQLFDLADEEPGPERIAAGKSEIRYLQRILDSLTKRQRAVFIECYIGDEPYTVLAERFGVTTRTIQSELREALIKVALRLDKDRFTPGSFKVSKE